MYRRDALSALGLSRALDTVEMMELRRMPGHPDMYREKVEDLADSEEVE